MDWKKLGKRLLFPPVFLLVLLTAASGVLLTVVFVRGWEQSVMACGVYVLSFYTLSVDCLFCALVLPKRYREIREKLHAIPLFHRYATDRVFRTRVSLHRSLVISLLYVAVNLWTWHAAGSWWFVVLAAYDGIMALMRFLLVGYVRKNEIGRCIFREWKRARLCACILLLVNLSLSGAVLMILYQNRGYDYPGVLIYVMALYTFYSAIHAVVDVVRSRKLGSPVLSTAKIISFSAALVSMLNLETAMFAQFGGAMAPEHQRLMIILTGAGVSVTIVTLAVLHIIKATKEIRRENYGTT